MYIIISPSKTQDFETKVNLSDKVKELVAISEWNEQTKQLAGVMTGFNANELGELMKISPTLAQLNSERFQKWNENYNKNVYVPAIIAFKGELYKGFDLANWKVADYKYAQKHLGIFSGFYGLIKPINYIQPYRLKMGLKFNFSTENIKGDTRKYKNLYDFWSELLTERIAHILKKEHLLINLASVEYSKIINRAKLAERMSPVAPCSKQIGELSQKAKAPQIIDVDFKICKVNKKTEVREKRLLQFMLKGRGDLCLIG